MSQSCCHTKISFAPVFTHGYELFHFNRTMFPSTSTGCKYYAKQQLLCCIICYSNYQLISSRLFSQSKMFQKQQMFKAVFSIHELLPDILKSNQNYSHAMCLCLNSELADIQNLLSFAFLIHRGYLPVVSCSEHNLLINFQFIDPKGNLSLLCTGYCYNKMLHKGASKIKAFYVHFNQYHFYLIYSPVLNFLAASKTKK